MDTANKELEKATGDTKEKIKDKAIEKEKATGKAIEKEKTIETIFVCSPWRVSSGNPKDMEREKKENERRAMTACRMITKFGCLPLAPHLYFTRFLDDNSQEEREEGLTLGLEWLALSDEIWVFGERISDGMSMEISFAREHGIPVRFMPEPCRMIETMFKQMIKNCGMKSDVKEDEEDVK